jgi:hypothetical protein
MFVMNHSLNILNKYLQSFGENASLIELHRRSRSKWEDVVRYIGQMLILQYPC